MKLSSRYLYKNSKLVSLAIVLLVVVALPLTLFFSRQSQEIRQRAAGTNCTSSGVTKNTDGTYHFSRLQVSSGNLIDENGCIVTLQGFNLGGVNNGDAVKGISEAKIAWLNQTFHMNYLRIVLNSQWWNSNVNVPNAGMSYQNFIKELITWAQKYGDYIVVGKGPEFPEPPCGGSITYCPPQKQGGIDYAADPLCTTDPTGCPEFHLLSTGAVIDSAVQMWQSFVPLYANDPHVFYDGWNEMHNIDGPTWRQSQETLIQTIRSIAPNSLITLGGNHYGGDITVLSNGTVPDLTEPNLVLDIHAYDGQCGDPLSPWIKNWPAEAQQEMTWAKNHNHAMQFGEWGGACDDPTYSSNLTGFAYTNHMGLLYFQENYMGKPGQLSANGNLVLQEYISLPQGGIPTSTPQPTATPTNSPTPTAPVPTPTFYCLGTCPTLLPSITQIPPSKTPTPPLSVSPVLTCTPRPACLDANPPCRGVPYPQGGWCQTTPQPTLSIEPTILLSVSPEPTPCLSSGGSAPNIWQGLIQLFNWLQATILQLFGKSTATLPQPGIAPSPCGRPIPSQPLPTPTCIPRPACLDSVPRCMIPEPINGWCPVVSRTPTPPQGCIYKKPICTIACPVNNPDCCPPTLVCLSVTPTTGPTCIPIPPQCGPGKLCPYVIPIGTWCPQI